MTFAMRTSCCVCVYVCVRVSLCVCSHSLVRNASVCCGVVDISVASLPDVCVYLDHPLLTSSPLSTMPSAMYIAPTLQAAMQQSC